MSGFSEFPVSHVLEHIKGVYLEGTHYLDFVEAVKARRSEVLDESQKVKMDGDYKILHEVKGESEIIPGEEVTKQAFAVVNSYKPKLEMFDNVISALEQKSKIKSSELDAFLEHMEVSGIRPFAENDEKQEESFEKFTKDQRMRAYAAVVAAPSVDSDLTSLFNSHILKQTGREAEYATEYFVKQYIEVPSDEMEFLQEFEMGQGDEEDKSKYKEFDLEQEMISYLEWKINPDEKYFNITSDVSRKLEVYEQLLKMLDCGNLHMDAIIAAIDSCFSTDPTNEYDDSGTPENVIERIKGGERLVLDPEKFELYYMAYTKDRLGHAKSHLSEQYWERAEKTVLTYRADLSEVMGRSRG